MTKWRIVIGMLGLHKGYVEALAVLQKVAADVTACSRKLSGEGPRIWAVASGKGGVGKSFIVSNLGLALAQRGKRVILVDLDLGGANLHTHLGIARPWHSLPDFINGKHEDLHDIIHALPDSSLGLISAASTDLLEIANIKHFQKQKIMRHIEKLRADYVILDLGAGTTYNTLDFFNMAERGIIPVLPEPTSIENAHRFLKAAMFRRLRDVPEETRKMIKGALESSEGQSLKTLDALVSSIERKESDHGKLLRESINGMSWHLVVNQIREPAQHQLGNSLALVWHRYFGRKPEHLCHLTFDESVSRTLCQKKRFIETYPQSRVAIHLKQLVDSMLDGDAD